LSAAAVPELVTLPVKGQAAVGLVATRQAQHFCQEPIRFPLALAVPQTSQTVQIVPSIPLLLSAAALARALITQRVPVVLVAAFGPAQVVREQEGQELLGRGTTGGPRTILRLHLNMETQVQAAVLAR
jgi:hypothetical protein